jgi:hypothetical protein
VSAQRSAERARRTLLIALVLTVLSLGIPWIGETPGYRTGARFYLAVAIGFLALALAKRVTSPGAAGHAVTGALVSLSILLALALRAIGPSALVLTVGTIVLLLSVRFSPRRS